MKNISIKSFVVAAALIVATAISASAQDLTSYFVTGSVERNEHNAAFAPDRGYFSIPLVGSISLSTSGNISLDKLLYPMDGELVTLFDTRVSAEDALANLGDVNMLGVSNRLSILSFGSYTRDRSSFWSFGLNLRTSANMSMPYEFFEFFKTAPEYSSISNVNFSMESYAEMSLGYSRRLKILDEKLTVGARFKVLAGLARVDFNIDQMDVSLTGDEWVAQASGTMDMYIDGMTMEQDRNDAGQMIYDMDSIDGTFSGPAGYGGAIDFGLTYDWSERLRFSAAINDVGFIKWNASSNTHATIANEFSFSGAEVDAETGDVEDSDDVIQLDDIELVAGESRSSTKWLQATFNAGAEYGFLDNRIGVGGVYSMRMWESQTIHNVALAVTLRPTKWFTFATNYNISTSSDNTVGLAVNIATGFINLYLATDVIASRKTPQYIPINQSAMNVSFGLAVPLGKRGERNFAN